MPTSWFEYVKPRLAAGATMSQASAEYFERYYPELYADARLIAEEAIARAGRLVIPDNCEVPEDLPIGLQLLAVILERKALGS